MAAARKGSAMKMRRSTPIFHTVRQASPSEGGASTGMSTGASGAATAVPAAPLPAWAVAQRDRLTPLGCQHLLGQLHLLVAAPRGLAQAQADQDDDGDRQGEDEERRTPRPDGGQPGAEQHAGDGADADAGSMGRVDPRPRRDRVVVRQQRVVGGEDHRLTHGDADQHDGRPHHRLGRAQPDGEGGADRGADQRDAHPVGAVGQDGDRQREGQRGGARDSHDEQDAGVGEVEGIADVGREHVERALRGLVEQLDPEEHGEREQGHAAAQSIRASRLTAPAPGRPGRPSPVGGLVLRRTSAATAQSRRSEHRPARPRGKTMSTMITPRPGGRAASSGAGRWCCPRRAPRRGLRPRPSPGRPRRSR